jgi:hypothetical protein
MRRLTHRLLGIAVFLGAVGVLAGCDADSDADSEPEAASTTVASSRDAAVDSAAPPAPSAQDCRLVGNVSVVVAQVATINESSSVASAEAARDALLSSVKELTAGSPALRGVDVKALNEGLAEVASAVSSASRAQAVESAVSSLQGSARDLKAAIQEVQDHFGCGPRTG